MATSAARWLTIGTYVLVIDGVAALYAGGMLGALATVVVGVAIVASLWHEGVRTTLGRYDAVAALLAGAASVVDLLYLAATTFDGLIHLLLFLVVYKLFTRATVRDARDIAFIAFFMLVAAAPGTFDVTFLAVLVVFVVAGTAVLILRTVLVDGARDGRPPAVAVGGRDVAVLSLTAAVATLAIAATLFFVMPRIGQAALPFHVNAARIVSGFSERVALGAFGEIETDAAVVMRVRLADGTPNPERIPELRWRGIALDHFDGRTWSREEPDRLVLHRSLRGTFDLARPRSGGRLLAQEIYLEPLGTEVLFAASRALHVIAPGDTLVVDGAGSMWSSAAASRVQYVVESELRGPGARRNDPFREVLTGDARERYVQLPPLAPRVVDLARRVASGSRTAHEAATRLTAYLSERYTYSTALTRRTELPPVEEFLFVSRAGNCEYFAATLAVMLRSLGIPARVVNGFQRGEWNPYGGYFMVRLLDAHSWVEAWLDDAGWVTFDPSPRAVPGSVRARSPIALYLDALRLRWYRYVVNWSLHDQVAAATRVRATAASWASSREWLSPRASLPSPWTTAGTVAIATAIVAAWRRARRHARVATRPVPRFYARTLGALARRGLRPAAGETAREFGARAASVIPACSDAIARLTAAYERARFGGVALDATEVDALEASASSLRRARVRRPPASD